MRSVRFTCMAGSARETAKGLHVDLLTVCPPVDFLTVCCKGHQTSDRQLGSLDSRLQFTPSESGAKGMRLMTGRKDAYDFLHPQAVWTKLPRWYC